VIRKHDLHSNLSSSLDDFFSSLPGGLLRMTLYKPNQRDVVAKKIEPIWQRWVSCFRYGYFNSLLLFSMLVFYSGYAYFYARNVDKYGDVILVVMLLFAIPRIGFLQEIRVSRISLFFFLTFLFMCLIGVLFPESIYASTSWFKKAVGRLLLSIGILSASSCVTRVDLNVSRYAGSALSVILSSIAILVSTGVVAKENLALFPSFSVVLFGWNDKYHAFWFVFFMWFIVALMWRRGKASTLLSLVVMSLTFWAVFLTSSESAQLSLVVALLVFLFCHIRIGRMKYGVYAVLFFLMFIPPIAWILPSALFPCDWSVFSLDIPQGIASRIPFYDTTIKLFLNKPLLGYGFGSSLSIPVPPELFGGSSVLPGGHPHNIVLLFLLEHGMVGYCWLFSAMFMLFNYTYKSVEKYRGAPAVWAMLISAQIIFSLSFDMWQPDVVMIYTMLFVLLRLCIADSRAN